jgi:O-antigen/teichoic acid export membrane protein
MLDFLRKTVKHTAIYSLGNLSTKIIGLILLPLYTSYLTTSEYGILAILEVTSQFFVTIVGLGISSGMMRWYAVETSEAKKKSIVFTVLSTLVALAITMNLAFFPFNHRISDLFFGHADHNQYFMLLWLWVAFEMINRVAFDLLRLKERSLFFIVLVIVKFTSILLFNIYFIVYMGYGVKGIIISQVLGNALIIAGTSMFLLKNLRFSFDYKILREILSFSVPLVFSTVSTMALALSDRYLIKYFLDYSEVGIYSLGYKIASVINLFLIQSFLLGFSPLAYKIFNHPGAKPYFAKITTYFVYALLGLSLVLIFFSKEVIMVFASSNDDYLLAYNVIPLLCLAFVFRGINYIVSMGLHYVKKTKYTAYIVFSVAVLNILLNLLMIPAFGINGAAIVSVLANFSMMVMFYIYSQRYYSIQYEFLRIGKLFVISGIFFFAGHLTGGLDIWTGILVKLGLLVLFPVAVYATGFYEQVELNRLKGAWLKWRNPLDWPEQLKNFDRKKPDEPYEN